jgi:hypothetical protein
MADATKHLVQREITVEADADTVFGLIADVAGWSQVFSSVLHAETGPDPLPGTSTGELCRIWALIDGERLAWTSRRTLDWERRTVSFSRIEPIEPVAFAVGEWQVVAVDQRYSQVVLIQEFSTPAQDDDAAARWEQLVGRETDAQLSALRTAAQTGPGRAELQLTFSVSEFIDAPEAGVLDALGRSDRPDSSVRIGFPDRRTVVRKEYAVPPQVAAHTARWTVEEEGDGTRVVSWHTVTLDPVGVFGVHGSGATLADAREAVTRKLSTESTAQLGAVRAALEAGGPR